MEQYLQNWYKNNVKWAGSDLTNKSSRRGYAPEIIVDHITDGSAQSCINWFNSPNNTQSSAHFLVARDGKAYQFVAIEDNAWANGIDVSDIPKAKAAIVKSKGVNPNWYSVSIEHEGIYNETRGALTQKQLESTIMLHRYIIAYVKDRYNTTIPANRNHILGHYEINPTRKPNCPGEKYPFDYIITELNRKETIELTWREILKKVASAPEEWERAINTAVNLATIQGDIGDLKQLRFLPLLIEKIYNSK
mgnify:FL=1